ncbi:MAG: PleD family two-component system response regulator [Saprospiraceae bacterium]
MNKQVLIVDDSPVMRTLLTEVLRKNYTIKSTSDGIEALEFLLQAEPVDALILDLSMPRMGGVDLLKRVRSMAAFVSLPVLVLSGHYESLSRIAAIEAGANDFMTKPFNPLELKLRLSRLLPQERQSVQQSGYASVIKMMRSSVQAI